VPVENQQLLVVVVGTKNQQRQKRETYFNQDYSQDVIKSNVFDDSGVLENESDVLPAVDEHMIPEKQKGLFILVDGNCRLGQFRVENLPQLHEIRSELQNKLL
jgi:hypothetical protein